MVEKSGEKVYQDGRLHGSFQRLARVVASPIILAHIRYKSSGKVDECHAHPFALDFWGQSWIFAHNGKAPAMEPYESRHRPVLEADSDSARTFEFLRDCFLEAEPRRPPLSFLQILREALVDLIRQYPGEYNFLLTNGRFLWAFTNHRQFLLLKGSRSWKTPCCSPPSRRASARRTGRKIAAAEGTWGKILLMAGGDLVLTEDLVPPADVSRRISQPRCGPSGRPDIRPANPPFSGQP